MKIISSNPRTSKSYVISQSVRLWMKTLNDTPIGAKVKVIDLHGKGSTKRRIMDMGITQGCEIYVCRVAPLGDPIELTVRGYQVSIRKAEAEIIEVR